MYPPETKASERLLHEAFIPIYNEYGFDKSYANAYPAHCNKSFAYEIFARGFQAGRSHPAPGVMGELQDILKHLEFVEGKQLGVWVIGKSIGEGRYETWNDGEYMVSVAAKKLRALAKNTPPTIKTDNTQTLYNCLARIKEMEADIIKAKETLKIYANRDLFAGNYYPSGYTEAEKTLAALEKYGESK